MITVAAFTHTGLLSAAEIQAWVGSAQIWLTQDFCPAWGIEAQVVYVPPGGTILGDWYQLGFFDHSDQADALGYHDLTPNHQPLSKIFTADVIADGSNWNVTGGHELGEMLVDPFIDQTVDWNGWRYAKEACDAPEDDRWGKRVAGHLMSNAVTPAWFDPNGQPPYTIYPCPEITRPFGLAAGGYIGCYQLPNGQWTQRMAQEKGPRQSKRPSSRTIKRFQAAA